VRGSDWLAGLLRDVDGDRAGDDSADDLASLDDDGGGWGLFSVGHDTSLIRGKYIQCMNALKARRPLITAIIVTTP
jgi:hypothetical protein